MTKLPVSEQGIEIKSDKVLAETRDCSELVRVLRI